MNIPWKDERYRGHYCEIGAICYKSGYIAARYMPEEYIEAYYYNTPDDAIPWDESPIQLSKYSVKPEDEYDVEADERAEEAEENREDAKERRYYGRYIEHIREDWN